MDWFNFSDPVFLLLCAGLLLIAFWALSSENILKQLRMATEAASLRLQRKTSERNETLLNQDTNVADRQAITKYGDTKRIDTNEKLNEAKGLSKIHLDEITGEDAAALRAARERDKYEEKRRGRVQTRGTGHFVSVFDGQEPDASTDAARDQGLDDKAADRHRKPKTPDPAPGA